MAPWAPPVRRVPGTLHGCSTLSTRFRSISGFPARASVAAGGAGRKIKAGACGLKVHEDWGTTPAAIDNCLSVADVYDIQVMLHTDTLNETGFLDDTIDAFKGRSIHASTPRAGGGQPRTSSRSPAEVRSALLDQSDPAVHPQHHRRASRHADGLPPSRPVDPRGPGIRECRIRTETIAAEDILHEFGVFDDVVGLPGDGPARRVMLRTWQTADKMKKQPGALPQDRATTTISA